ncbi:MAG: DUF2442 domain-containing protein [Chlorobiaceae bacterium]|nr:DUF2442 domain-containing protein [Chlorobiaceae bacterium]
MEQLLDVITVSTHDDYTLELVHSPLFFKASVQYGTVVWPGNLDMAPETFWSRSVPA